MKICIVGNQARSTYLFWGTCIQSILSKGHDVLIMVPEGAPLKDVQALHGLTDPELGDAGGVEVLTYPLQRRGLNFWQEYKSFRALHALLREEKSDIVFATTIKPIIYSSLALNLSFSRRLRPTFFACITGLGYMFEESTTPKEKRLRSMVRAFYAYALRGAKKVFFQNVEDKELFIQQGIVPESAREKCVLCRATGVNIRHFALNTTYPEKPTFLLMARLLEAKGLQDFVLAARILKGSYPEARFQILGPPEEGVGSISLEQIQAWHEEGSIEYLGSSEDVRPYIAQASVMVLPSWREGTPCAILEGMSMGRAAVVSDVPGCREVVISGENGFLVPPKSPAALAEGLERFILAPQLIAHMGAKGRKRVEKHFDATQVAHLLLREMGM